MCCIYSIFVSVNNHLAFPGIDLALLSQANHSIMSYGTFGMWGAFLAGGDVTVPESHRNEGSIGYILAANLTNFIFL